MLCVGSTYKVMVLPARVLTNICIATASKGATKAQHNVEQSNDLIEVRRSQEQRLFGMGPILYPPQVLPPAPPDRYPLTQGLVL